MSNYPDGFTQRDHDAAFDRLDPPPDERDLHHCDTASCHDAVCMGGRVGNYGATFQCCRCVAKMYDPFGDASVELCELCKARAESEAA